MIAIAAFLLLVIFTGYLIIYNIFQISVAGDIRFYGLLKTIGTTPRQLKRIIRQQALLLCLIGIPAGLLLGYGIGAVLVPVVLRSTQLDAGITTISTSPVIFLGSMLFALLTVLLSCSKPGKMAARVSPVEATKYTDAMQTKKKQRSTRGAKLHQMAFANLGRNKKKTVLVVVSLALSVTLFNALCAFVGGFSMEKYVSSMTCADFIVSTPDYFRYNPADEFITPGTNRRDRSKHKGQSFRHGICCAKTRISVDDGGCSAAGLCKVRKRRAVGQPYEPSGAPGQYGDGRYQNRGSG